MTKEEEVKTISPEEQQIILESQYSLSHPGVFHNSLILVLQEISQTLIDLKNLLEGKPEKAEK